MIVKTIIFFSVPVIFGSAGDSISSSSLLYITRFHAWLNIRRNFPAIFITAWETNVISLDKFIEEKNGKGAFTYFAYFIYLAHTKLANVTNVIH